VTRAGAWLEQVNAADATGQLEALRRCALEASLEVVRNVHEYGRGRCALRQASARRSDHPKNARAPSD